MGKQATFSERVREHATTLAELGVNALGALHDLTARRLVRYAVTLTRNQHDAEDAVQAVLVRVAARPKAACGSQMPLGISAANGAQ